MRSKRDYITSSVRNTDVSVRYNIIYRAIYIYINPSIVQDITVSRHMGRSRMA